MRMGNVDEKMTENLMKMFLVWVKVCSMSSGGTFLVELNHLTALILF